ncbi:hypothetical protein PMAYCL1PPCAC_03250, partial [Pristionchus mayeri]
KEPANFPKITRMISYFSRIGVLVFEKSGILDEKDEEFFNAVQSSLGDAKIDRLEVFEKTVGEQLQIRIVDLCRKHRIRKVSIETGVLTTSTFKNFVSQLVHLGATLDLIENTHSNHLVYFNKSRVFWDKLKEGLKEENVSMRMLTRHDDDFHTNYTHYMRTHIRCE